METKRLTRIALGALLLFVSQVGLSAIPNVEVVTLLILIYAMLWDGDAIWMALIFTLLEGAYWGFGVWWFTYLFLWPGFAIVSKLILRNLDNWFLSSVFMGAFGLVFGAIFAIPYLFYDPMYALNYWIVGIPFDLIHGVGNFAVGMVAGPPIYKMLLKVKNKL